MMITIRFLRSVFTVSFYVLLTASSAAALIGRSASNNRWVRSRSFFTRKGTTFPQKQNKQIHWNKLEEYRLPAVTAFTTVIQQGQKKTKSLFSKTDEDAEDNNNNDDDDDNNIDQLKLSLLKQISEFRKLQERDGEVSIDFGVKGGELNATNNRAPSKIDYYMISKDVGKKAEDIMETCNKLSTLSPTVEPTQFLGNKQNGTLAPLNGPWKLLFTTAADASFSKNSTRGAAKAQNIVNAQRGRITNVIDFATMDDGTEPLVKQLNVVIRATAVNAKRVALQFQYAKVVFTKLFFLKWKWALYIPVPATFISRCYALATKFLNLFRSKTSKKKTELPMPYFDILYLDENLRIHKTGEDNLFIQTKEDWIDARPLLL